MKRRSSKLLLVIFACIGVVCLLLVQGLRREKFLAERRSDVEALVQVCFGATNVTTTDDLLAMAAQQHVRLWSPIPKDLNKPCYQLINPWTGPISVFIAGKMLIIETNVTDNNGRFVAQMDGSVLYVSVARLHAADLK